MSPLFACAVLPWPPPNMLFPFVLTTLVNIGGVLSIVNFRLDVPVSFPAESTTVTVPAFTSPTPAVMVIEVADPTA